MDLTEFIHDVGRLHRVKLQFAGRDMDRSEAEVLSAVAQHPLVLRSCRRC
jgi:hypothetical protein